MRITQINAYSDAGKATVSLNVESDLPISEALASVLALFAGAKSYDEDNAAREAMQAARNAAAAKSLSRLSEHGGPGIQEHREHLASERGIGGTGDERPSEPKVDEPAAKATRTRRPRANPDAAPAEPVLDANQAEVQGNFPSDGDGPKEREGRRRTRVTQEPTTPEVKTITDADLAKACSNAAAIVGIEVVQAVIADFHVASMQELAPDVRERFLSELQGEIELAKAELAAAAK